MLGLRNLAGHKTSYEAFARYVAHAGPSSRRSISTSRIAHASQVGHYEALSLPRNATRQQVKARFYELSKKHHPDAPGGNTAKFHQINDAYATLGNDTKRRQYDQSMSPSPSSPGWHPSGGLHRPHRTGPSANWGRTPPRRAAGAGAAAAGGGGYHNPFAQRPPPNYDPFASGTPPQGRYARTDDPFGRTARRRGGVDGDGEPEIRSEGALWRFVVVVGLLVAVVSFGGGLTASADAGDLAHPQEVAGEEEAEEQEGLRIKISSRC